MAGHVTHEADIDLAGAYRCELRLGIHLAKQDPNIGRFLPKSEQGLRQSRVEGNGDGIGLV